MVLDDASPSGLPTGAITCRSAGGIRGVWAPEASKALTIGLVLTITLVASSRWPSPRSCPRSGTTSGVSALYGWVFSGFFLASLLGIVVSGQLADRRGLALPFVAGLVLFSIGLVVGGLAARCRCSSPAASPGFGAGAIPSVGYAAIGRGYPARLRSRMFATTSTAWVVPGWSGPAIAAVVEHTWTWRWCSSGSCPRRRGRRPWPCRPSGAGDLRRVGSGSRAGHGGSRNTGGSTAARPRARAGARCRGGPRAGSGCAPALAVVLVVIGLPLSAWASSVWSRPGRCGSAPACRPRWRSGASSPAASSAPTPTSRSRSPTARGASTWMAGAALSAGSVLWAIGSWTQARLIDRVGLRTARHGPAWG